MKLNPQTFTILRRNPLFRALFYNRQNTKNYVSWEGVDCPKTQKYGFVSSGKTLNAISKTSLAPSNCLTSSSLEEAVKLRTDPEAPNNYDPITVPQLLNRAASEAGNLPALRIKRNGEYSMWTYEDYLRDVRYAARAMIQIGQKENCGVCILGSNNPEWLIANLGGIFGGGISVGIYPTSSPDVCKYIMNHCQCQIVFVENEEQLNKILEIKSSLPSLKKIVQFIGNPPNEPGVISWKEFMSLGREQGYEKILEDTLSKMAANKCCQIVYTSGTTGKPKGVMLSHDNVIFLAQLVGETYGLNDKDERFVSYLPLNHIAALSNDIYLTITYKSTLTFADKNALKGTLTDTLKDCRPTFFFGVPRVYEKMMETEGLKKMEHTLVKDQLGFDKCRNFMVVGAPLCLTTIEYFATIGILLMDGYGMSESSGPHTVNVYNSRRLGSVGRSLKGLSTKIIENGEICMKGRNIMMGYLNDPKATEEVFTEDGFLKSGDLGELDSDGFLYITGRQKELLITAGGENVPPVPIEDALKKVLPILSNAMVIGDKQKYLSCFLSLKVVLDPNTLQPSDTLSTEALDWCESQGSKAQRVSEIIASSDDKVFAAIQEGINKYNSVAASNAQKIQKWIIIPKDFSVATEELGPTLKMKRHFILKKYDNLVQKMYS